MCRGSQSQEIEDRKAIVAETDKEEDKQKRARLIKKTPK